MDNTSSAINSVEEVDKNKTLVVKNSNLNKFQKTIRELMKKGFKPDWDVKADVNGDNCLVFTTKMQK